MVISERLTGANNLDGKDDIVSNNKNCHHFIFLYKGNDSIKLKNAPSQLSISFTRRLSLPNCGILHFIILLIVIYFVKNRADKT